MKRAESGFGTSPALLFTAAILTLSALCLFSATTVSALTPQGKGGTIKPAPTPAPAAKKTTQPKRSTTNARTPRASSMKPANTEAAEIAFWNTIKESTNPEDFRAYLKEYPQGKFVQLAKNRLDALEAPARAAAARKKEAEEHSKLGNAFRWQKRWAEAEAEFRKAVSLDPSNPDYVSLVAQTLVDQKKNAEAEIEWGAFLDKHPVAESYVAFGKFLADQRRWPEAEVSMREAVRLRPDGENYSWLAVIFYRQGKWTEMEAADREALRLKPDEHSSRLRLNGNYIRQEKWVEAEAILREGINADPERANYWHVSLGDTLMKQRKWTEAESAYRESIRLNPGWHAAHANLADALVEQRRLKEAEAEYREAIRVEPDQVWVYYKLGDLLEKQNRLEDAAALYREGLRQNNSFANSEFEKRLQHVTEALKKK